MYDVLTNTVFRVGSRAYSWIDILLFAWLQPDWGVFEDAMAFGVSAYKHAEKHNLLPETHLVEAGLNEFRYQHNLLAAEEVEDWLIQRSLTLSDLIDFITFSVLRQHFKDQKLKLLKEYSVSDHELRDMLLSEGYCSGYFNRAAKELSEMLALYDLAVEKYGVTDHLLYPDQERVDAVEHGVINLLKRYALEWHNSLPLREAIRQYLSFENMYPLYSEMSSIQTQINLLIRSNQIEWTKVDYDVLEFKDDQVAREAALCAREGTFSIIELAEENIADLSSYSHMIKDLQPELNDVLSVPLVTAREGEIIGPLEINGRYVLIRLKNKELPDLDNRSIRELALKTAVRNMAVIESTRRVNWLANWLAGPQ
ncbi:MAG: hypothetical protein D6719_12180 [Candidatus Dadabacteria bacterium]|nr:MAG: hypothetical protein D6719_12180 [Candidatus Dadabacteria bacterium]